MEPLLEVLVGKCLEQGLMEVLEEEELAAMRAHQQHYEQVSCTNSILRTNACQQAVQSTSQLKLPDLCAAMHPPASSTTKKSATDFVSVCSIHDNAFWQVDWV